MQLDEYRERFTAIIVNQQQAEWQKNRSFTQTLVTACAIRAPSDIWRELLFSKNIRDWSA